MNMYIINRLLFIIALFSWIYFFIGYGAKNDILGGDSLGYYSYLPSAFIYKNLDNMEKSNSDIMLPDRFYNYIVNPPYDNPKTPKGVYLIQYTIGVALMELPFFLLGHLFAIILGFPIDGFSIPYYTAIKICNLVYFGLGIYFTYKSLVNYFSSAISQFVCLLLFIGTHLLYFTSFHFGMSHIPIFYLYAAVVYYTIQIYEKPRWIYFILLGFCIGLIGLIRITDMVALLITILYQVNSCLDMLRRLEFWSVHKAKIFMGALFFLLPFLPQLVYWKIMTNSFFYYSYGQQKLNLSNPHIMEGWFGPDNGWLQYSPVMIIAFIGLFFIKRNPPFGLAAPIIFILYSYLIYSWFCFQYINGLGSRPMIDIYPLLAFSMAAFLSWILDKGMVLKFIFTCLLCLAILVNLSFTYKQLNGQLWSEDSSFTFNVSTVFKHQIDKKDLVSIEIPYLQPRDLENYHKKSIFLADFEKDMDSRYDSISDSRVLEINKEEYSKILASSIFDKNDIKDLAFIRISGWFYLYNSSFNHYQLSELVFNIKRDGNSIFNKACKIDNKLWDEKKNIHQDKRVNLFEVHLNNWAEVEFYIPYPVHKELKQRDLFEVYVTNQAKSKLLIDNIEISYIYKN